MKTQLKIRAISFKRYKEHDLMQDSIELHLDGRIPAIGLGSKKIIKLLKKELKDNNFLI